GIRNLIQDSPMRARTLRWILAAAVVALLVVGGRLLPLREWLRAFADWVSGLGPAGYLLYVAGYVAATVLLLPAWLMTIAAGIVFGLWRGVAVVSVGSTAGAAASFLIARHLAREPVARWAS